jgi:hypothetical protein
MAGYELSPEAENDIFEIWERDCRGQRHRRRPG